MKKIISFLFLSLSIVSYAQSKSVLAKSFYTKAEKEFEAKSYNNSLKMLDKAKEYLEGETYSKIEYLYVMNHFKLRKYYKADVHLQKYFSLNPSDNSSMYAEILEVLPDIKTKAKKNKAFEELKLILNKIGVLKVRKGYENQDFSVLNDGSFYWKIFIKKNERHVKVKLDLKQNFDIYIKEYDKYDFFSLRFEGESLQHFKKFKNKEDYIYSKNWKSYQDKKVYFMFSTNIQFLRKVKKAIENFKAEL